MMGLSFSGGQQRADIRNENFVNGWTEYTVCSWIKSNITNTDKGWVNFSVPDGRDRHCGPRYDVGGFSGGGTNVIKFGLEINGVEISTESRSNVQTTNLQHVVGRWKTGDRPEIFIDNDNSGATAIGATGVGSISNNDDIIIGQGPKESATASWNGIVYEVRVYEKWLTDREIGLLFSAKGTDTLFDGLRLWYKFFDGSFGTSPNTLIDWSESSVNLPIIGSPTFAESSIGFRRR